jgi:predicted component of type VI protein secretion system
VLSRLGLATNREKDLWEAFARRHADLEAIGRTFRALFGDQFTRAYISHAPMGSGPSL